MDYWIGFLQGAGAVSVLYFILFELYRRAQDKLVKLLTEQRKEMYQEALKSAVAHDALLHVLRNRNDEGEE